MKLVQNLEYYCFVFFSDLFALSLCYFVHSRTPCWFLNLPVIRFAVLFVILCVNVIKCEDTLRSDKSRVTPLAASAHVAVFVECLHSSLTLIACFFFCPASSSYPVSVPMRCRSWHP